MTAVNNYSTKTSRQQYHLTSFRLDNMPDQEYSWQPNIRHKKYTNKNTKVLTNTINEATQYTVLNFNI